MNNKNALRGATNARYKNEKIYQLQQLCRNLWSWDNNSDVTITIYYTNMITRDQKIIYARKDALERNTFLKRMLRRRKGYPNNTSSIDFGFDVDIRIFESVVRYLNSGSIWITESNVFAINRLSDYLGEEDLVEFCNNFIMTNASNKNIIEINHFARDTDSTNYKLVNKVRKYICENFTDLAKRSDAMQWPAALLIEVLSSDEVIVYNEESVLQFASRWLRADFAKRKEFMNDVLGKIRFSFIDPQNLLDTTDDDVNLKLRQLSSTCMMSKSNNTTRDVVKPRRYFEGLYILYIKTHSGDDDNRNAKFIFQRFSTIDSYVQTLTPPPRALGQYPGVVIDDKMYFIGEDLGERDYSREVNMYDLSRNTWSSVAPMNFARHSPEYYAMGGKIYVFDGYKGSSVEVYDPDENCWEILPGSTELRRRLYFWKRTVVVGDSFYIFHGGRDPSEGCTILKYSPSNNKVVELPHRHKVGVKPVMYVQDSKVFIFKTNQELLVYDTDSGVFEETNFTRPQQMCLSENQWKWISRCVCNSRICFVQYEDGCRRKIYYLTRTGQKMMKASGNALQLSGNWLNFEKTFPVNYSDHKLEERLLCIV